MLSIVGLNAQLRYDHYGLPSREIRRVSKKLA